MTQEPLLRVMSLHALKYCERLFFLEEVEEIRVADERVFSGRILHERLDQELDTVQLVLQDTKLGLKGRIDALRRKNGQLIPYEHKRGRSRDSGGASRAWDSDRIQVGAYGLLLEAALGVEVTEGRVRYEGDNKLVNVPIDGELRDEVRVAIERARYLRSRTERPPVTENERLCPRCSLAPVCLPEETRKALDQAYQPQRLFPSDDARRNVHVLGHGTKVGRSGNQLRIRPRAGQEIMEPIEEVRSVTVHGFGVVSSQALQLCSDHGIAVHWFGAGGWYTGSFWKNDLAVQRRIRQYEALRQPELCLKMARHVVHARAEGQLRFLLRGTRGLDRNELGVLDSLATIRRTLSKVPTAISLPSLLGLEGKVAAEYFGTLPSLLSRNVSADLHPSGRSKRPPKDRFNALLSFGYGMLLREVVQAIRTVGLDAAFGFYHQPRSAAPPLALDLMELFRVPLVDMAVVGAVNRRQFDSSEDFRSTKQSVWLTSSGRKKMIRVFEKRLTDDWRHPVLDYSISYRRHIELEVRLAEKEWTGEPNMFARTRLR